MCGTSSLANNLPHPREVTRRFESPERNLAPASTCIGERYHIIPGRIDLEVAISVRLSETPPRSDRSVSNRLSVGPDSPPKDRQDVLDAPADMLHISWKERD